jgi:hypothetical protein
MLYLSDIGARQAPLTEHFLQPPDDGTRVVLDAGGHLLGVQASFGIKQDDISERPADVDADAIVTHSVAFLPSNTAIPSRSFASAAAVAVKERCPVSLNQPPKSAATGPPWDSSRASSGGAC